MKKIAMSMFVSACLALGAGCGGDAKKDDKKAEAKKADENKADEKKADEKKADAEKADAEQAKQPDEKAAMPKPAVITVSHLVVEDFAKWKNVFDSHSDMRMGSGAMMEWVYQNPDNPNDIVVAIAGSDVEKAKAFAGSEELKKAMAEAGMKSAPEMFMFTPTEDMDPPEETDYAANVFVIHQVADFAKWKEGFDAHADARKQAGFIGHHMGQSLDDPNLVGIQLHSTDLAKAKAFVESPDLEEAMKNAGVQGEPKVYVTGGMVHEKMYAGEAAPADAPPGDAEPTDDPA